jgi:hypothetical protein
MALFSISVAQQNEPSSDSAAAVNEVRRDSVQQDGLGFEVGQQSFQVRH